jgi:1-acyl-sn-glycerol-3-phosphate acyltransferase
MRALGSIWSWFAIVMVVVVGGVLHFVVAALTIPFDRRRAVAGRFLRLMAVTSAKLHAFWRFGVYGPIPPRGRRPRRTVVVSNHASHADAFLISHLPWEMKWLAKESLFKVPFFGWSMWLAGDVKVRRGERASAEEALGRCRRWLERGMPVMIFPEGTRSKTGDLLPFKDGAFRLALDAGADLLPIAVHGTETALPKHSWIFAPSRARVAVGTPIATAGKSVAELKDEARAQIEALRAEMARDA